MRRSKTPKGGRKERHAAATRALSERKKLRKKRAAIHGAMTEAARMVRSKKKGTRDFETNMRGLGFEPNVTGKYEHLVGRQITGDCTAKYRTIER